MLAFRVLNLGDTRKQGSDLEVGKIYEGMPSASGNQVYYTDMAGVDWIFYVNDTCEIIKPNSDKL